MRPHARSTHRRRRSLGTIVIVVVGGAVFILAMAWHGTPGLEDGEWDFRVTRRGISVELD